jgi:hypothetical protein
MAAMHPVEIADGDNRATQGVIGRAVAHDEEAFRRHRASMVKKTYRPSWRCGGGKVKHGNQRGLCAASSADQRD